MRSAVQNRRSFSETIATPAVKGNRFRRKRVNAGSLFIEPLESRQLLTSVIVNTIEDSTDATGSSVVSLRDAIAVADASSTPTTITFDPTVFATAQVITLSGTQLEISGQQATTIQGPSVGVSISGNFVSRVLLVDANSTANLSNLTLYEGTDSTGFGGGLENVGTTTATNVEFMSNSAYDGAGLYNYGTLTLLDSTVEYNVASIGNGGIGSTGTATLVNDTIYGNKSPAGTGGYGDDGVASLTNVTITNNSGDDFVGGFFTGDGETTIANSIIAGNLGEASTVVPDVYGAFHSEGNNLIGATDGSSGWIGSDLTGSEANPLNADLGTAGPNGGYTDTALPGSDSPALSNGSVALIPSGVTTDQRGLSRTINGTVDIGAVEVGGTAALNLPTTITLGASASLLTVGDSSLYEISVKTTNGSATPTGTVSLYEQGSLQGTYTLDDGQITEQIVPNQYAGQTTNFQAVYNGNSIYASSTSNTISQGVLDKDQYISTTSHGAVGGGIHLTGAAIHVSDPIKVTYTGPKTVGTFTFALDINTSAVGLDANPTTLEKLTQKRSLRPGLTFPVMLSDNKKLPSSIVAGTYYFTAEITNPDGDIEFVTIPTAVNVVAPVVTLTATAAAVKPAVLTLKKSGTELITITDTGNVPATGMLVITVLPSSDGINAAGDVALSTYSHRVVIPVNRPTRYNLRIKVPTSLADGLYDPLVSVALDGASASATGSQFTVAAVPPR